MMISLIIQIKNAAHVPEKLSFGHKFKKEQPEETCKGIAIFYV